VFYPFQDVAFFRRFALNPETNLIEGPKGASLAPEYLHEIGEPVPQPGL
jgi:hypothetical protein